MGPFRVFACLLPLSALYAQNATEREQQLLARIEELEKRLAAVEALVGVKTPPPPALEEPQAGRRPAPLAGQGPDPVAGLTASVTVDGYYSYNFNAPVGRINLLRAYDVLSNSFSLNQAALIFERAPDVAAGRRFGFRVDLQFGQATETLGGNPFNEPRPQVYRHLFQTYGTYVVPAGKGLTVDFGKWASALGYENNYTKDQFNYSRSYWFNFLPFYHFGFRAKYPAAQWLDASYWLVNGANQSEDYNGFKSQAILLAFKTGANGTFNLNYYNGIESPNIVPILNPGFPTLPTQPGLSTNVVRPTPHIRRQILDSYGSWNVTRKLTVAAEGDYVVQQGHTTGGAAYAAYRFVPRFGLAARAEYVADRGGLFSGVVQNLKEATLTADYRVADGFSVRGEWRRDFSNVPFFLTSVPGMLAKGQTTATLGLIWWYGKPGAW